MLYLEDYIEMIEHLPRELRDGFTELREIDLQVHNSADTLEERVKTFFSNARKMKPHEREAEYETIRKGHYKSLEDCDEKVQIAHQMYDLVDRHLRRLDQELHKFKMELEADNAGITEELERRSLEMDSSGGGAAAVDCQKENRYGSSHGGAAVSSSRRNHERKPVLTSTQAAAAASRREDRSSTLLSSVSTGAAAASSRHPTATSGYHQLQHVASSSASSSSCSSSTYSGGGVHPAVVPGAVSNALAAAASQAIAATQHMQQGRRTTAGGGVRSSYDSCSASELSVARELAGAAHAALASSGLAGNEKRKRKSNVASTPVPPISTASPTPSDEQLVGDMIIDPSGEEPWLYDANEPRYCVCQNVSYGDMVACDNRECPYEWFHYACVGITAPPKGKWYCPQCSVSMKRRRQK